MSKKYHIYDECGDNEEIDISKERFLKMISMEIEDYIDVSSKSGMKWNFKRFIESVINGEPFKLSMNGYTYVIEEE